MKLSRTNTLRAFALTMLFSSAFLWLSDGYASDPSVREVPLPSMLGPNNNDLQIVSPQAVYILQKQKEHLSRYPNVASDNLKIHTLEDFNNAKVYLDLMEGYNKILEVCLLESMCHPTMISTCLSEEGKLIRYAQILHKHNMSTLQSAQDEERLTSIYYGGCYRLGEARLFDFVRCSQLQVHSEYLKKKWRAVCNISNILSKSPDTRCHKDFIGIIRGSLVSARANHPLLLEDPSFARFVYEAQVEAQIQIPEYLKKRSEMNPNFNLNDFFAKSYQLALEYNNILYEPSHDRPKLLKDNMQSYFELEKEGLKFKNRIRSGKMPENDIVLNEASLRDFYDFLTIQLRHLPQKDPVVFLPNIILYLISADEKDQSLMRIKVLEYLLLKKGPNLSKNFIIFRAQVKAMCSDYDELNALFNLHPQMDAPVIADKSAQKLSEQQQKKQQKNRRKKEKKKERKKAALLATSKEPLNDISLESSLPLEFENKDMGSQKADMAAEDSSSYFKEPESTKQSLPNVREVVETSLEAPNVRSVYQETEPHTLVDAVSPSNSNEPVRTAKKAAFIQPKAMRLREETPELEFGFNSKCTEILDKIFTNDWKIARADIEAFFKEVGQKVDIKTGSSHHIIRISEGIVIIKNGKTIGSVYDLSANMDGHISLPKWDKIVPQYIRKEVRKLIDLMGITECNYKKCHNTRIIPK